MIYVVKRGDQYASSIDLDKPFTPFFFDAFVFNKDNIPDLRQVPGGLYCVTIKDEIKLVSGVRPCSVGSIIRLSLDEITKAGL